MRKALSSLLVIAALVATPLVGHAQSGDDVERSSQDAFELARSFAECAGFWDFMAFAESAAGNPASSANAHNIGNGARLSAGYMLSHRHLLENPNAAPRAYGSWDEFIEPLAEVTSTQMAAHLEQGDTSAVEQQATICVALGETSQNTVDEMRANRTREP